MSKEVKQMISMYSILETMFFTYLQTIIMITVTMMTDDSDSDDEYISNNRKFC